MNYSVNLSSGQTVEVVIGEAAQINVEQALNYIESGRVEITNYVNEWAKPEIVNYTNEYAKPIITEIVNQTTKPLIDDYLNTTTKPQIDEYVADNVKPYADSAQDSAAKAKISEDNAKTSETNAKASELATASSAGVASAAAVTATEAKDYTAKVLTDDNLKTVGQDLQSADSNIKKVATNIVNVNTVAKNIDNVNLLAPHTEAMEALASDIMDVVTVAGITEQTKNVSDNMAHVVDVDNNKANIDKAVANATNITTVATSINNVNAVAANKANIDNVAENKTNINNVSANITAVNNVSENMSDVKNAVQSANDAKLWAIGTKTEKPEGSSKYWAEQAKNVVQTPDATETVKGIVRLATSEEVTAGTNDSAAITSLKFKQKIAQDLKNPSADTIPSTKAVQDALKDVSGVGNLGDIKYTARTDTPEGGAWCNGAEYTQAMFPDIYQMLVTGKIQSTTYQKFASSISTNGSCGFFALDTDTKKFKVPLLTNVYIKAGQAPLMFGAESLPNIRGTFSVARENYNTNLGGAFTDGGLGGNGPWDGNAQRGVINYNASRSSSAYKDGAKVNPDHVVYRAYVVLYSSATEVSVAQAQEFMMALSGKANVALDNVSPAQSFKDMSIGWCMPDYSAGVSITTNGVYTPPANGYIRIFGDGINRTQGVQLFLGNKLDNAKSIIKFASGSYDAFLFGTMVVVAKGQEYFLSFNNTGTKIATFYPCKGEN